MMSFQIYSLYTLMNQDGHANNTALCKDMKKDAIANNKRYNYQFWFLCQLEMFSYIKMYIYTCSSRCQGLTEDVSAQCACWINQTIVIDRIKKFKCNAKSTQKLVTKHKVDSQHDVSPFINISNRMSALRYSKNVRRKRTSLWSQCTTAWMTTV